MLKKNYSQIEKEGLACVFGVKRFHAYLFGHHFTLYTDHKSLVNLFSEHNAVPSQASSRIQRWALTLSMYEYTMCFKPTTEHNNADAMSRLPLPATQEETPVPAEHVLLLEELNKSPVSVVQIRQENRRDSLLSRVLQFILSGWPQPCTDPDMKSFHSKRMELSTQEGVILWGNRVVIPYPARTPAHFR